MNLLGQHPKQFFQRGPSVPGVGDVQFARRLAEAGDRQDGGHRSPGDFLASRLNELLQQLIETQHPPQAPRQPYVAKISRAFQANAAEFDQQRLVVARLVTWRWIEEHALRLARFRFADQVGTQLGPAILFVGRQLAEISHDALSRTLGGAIRFDKRPIQMRLSILPPLEASEKHERSLTRDEPSPRIAQLR